MIVSASVSPVKHDSIFFLSKWFLFLVIVSSVSVSINMSIVFSRVVYEGWGGEVAFKCFKVKVLICVLVCDWKGISTVLGVIK